MDYASSAGSTASSPPAPSPRPDNAPLVLALAEALHATVIETHISWVLLAGDTAYKIKKAVRLPFVDYSSLSARQYFCREEVRLNRRLAPALYRGVTPISGPADSPVLDGPGEPLEYAVRMRRFPAGSLFSEKLDAGLLAPHQVDDFADGMAAFHRHAPIAPLPRAGTRESHYGSAQRRSATATTALHGAAPAFTAAEMRCLRIWMGREVKALAPLWERRREHGCVRECHGDLHLANVAVLDTGVCAFDAIEFDTSLRCIDILDDIAFAVMDFSARGHDGFAFRLLNRWLDGTGEHDALPALRFAVVSRALVRAQVATLRGPASEARRYAAAALAWARPLKKPQLVITFGLPGSGKSYESQRWLERERAIRLRSDVERKRMFGLGMLDGSASHGLDIYSEDATRRTYAHLLVMARLALHASWPVVLDAAFLTAQERRAARTLARKLAIPFGILACEAPTEVLRERIRRRRGDASEADESVLQVLAGIAEPLTPRECKFIIPAGSASG